LNTSLFYIDGAVYSAPFFMLKVQKIKVGSNRKIELNILQVDLFSVNDWLCLQDEHYSIFKQFNFTG